MDIKEIALKVGSQGLPIEGTAHKLCVLDFCSKEVLIDFAKALVAEIQRQSEPVAARRRVAIWLGGDNYKPEWAVVGEYTPGTEPLFTFPPSTEALEDKVAEACAAYLSNRAKPNLEAAQVMDDSVAAIRSGEWKKFMKGK